MNKKPGVITKGNVKMLAVEPETHQLAKVYAARIGTPLYVAVANALRVAMAIQDAQPRAEVRRDAS